MAELTDEIRDAGGETGWGGVGGTHRKRKQRELWAYAISLLFKREGKKIQLILMDNSARRL